MIIIGIHIDMLLGLTRTSKYKHKQLSTLFIIIIKYPMDYYMYYTISIHVQRKTE